MELDQEKLKKLLIEAEEAHSEYEENMGEKDEDWASWYAGYILEKLWEESGEELEAEGK